MNFKEIYIAPFKLDYFGNLVNTSDKERAFDFPERNSSNPSDKIHLLSRTEQLAVVDALNNHVTSNSVLRNRIDNELKYEKPTIMIKVGDEWRHFIHIRGWSHLTGVNGLNLDREQAEQIQEDFAKHIISVFK